MAALDWLAAFHALWWEEVRSWVMLLHEAAAYNHFSRHLGSNSGCGVLAAPYTDHHTIVVINDFAYQQLYLLQWSR
jgi:hypothetical protein